MGTRTIARVLALVMLVPVVLVASPAAAQATSPPAGCEAVDYRSFPEYSAFPHVARAWHNWAIASRGVCIWTPPHDTPDGTKCNQVVELRGGTYNSGVAGWLCFWGQPGGSTLGMTPANFRAFWTWLMALPIPELQNAILGKGTLEICVQVSPARQLAGQPSREYLVSVHNGVVAGFATSCGVSAAQTQPIQPPGCHTTVMEAHLPAGADQRTKDLWAQWKAATYGVCQFWHPHRPQSGDCEFTVQQQAIIGPPNFLCWWGKRATVSVQSHAAGHPDYVVKLTDDAWRTLMNTREDERFDVLKRLLASRAIVVVAASAADRAAIKGALLTLSVGDTSKWGPCELRAVLKCGSDGFVRNSWGGVLGHAPSNTYGRPSGSGIVLHEPGYLRNAMTGSEHGGARRVGMLGDTYSFVLQTQYHGGAGAKPGTPLGSAFLIGAGAHGNAYNALQARGLVYAALLGGGAS